MRLNAGFLSFLVVAAAALVAGVVLASTAPAKSPCKAADASMAQQIVSQAQHGYAAVLKATPGSKCAIEGMRRVITEMCQRADMLRTGDAKAEARAAYRAILALDPPDWDPKNPLHWNVSCAIRGLAALGPDPTQCAGCVGPPGKDGTDGKNGARGARGPRGRKGDPGRVYVLPCNCMAG